MILMNTNISEFIHRNKKIVCFGAGHTLRDFCRYFRYNNLDFSDYLCAILDNKATAFRYGGDVLPVHTIEGFLRRNDACMDGAVLLITSLWYAEIIAQLQKIDALRHTRCYIYPFVAITPAPYDFPKRQSGTAPKIPKRIHYIWFGDKGIPEQTRTWLKNWERHCPGYEIICWNNKNYDINKHPHVKNALAMKLFAHASDYARLDILYEYGGIYFDTDVEILSSLDALLYDEAFIGFSNGFPHVNSGGGIGAVKGHELVGEMLYNMRNISFADFTSGFNIERETDVLMDHGLIPNNQMQQLGGMRVYPTDVFSPLTYLGSPAAFTKNTLTIHHSSVSWYDEQRLSIKTKQAAGAAQFWREYGGALTQDNDLIDYYDLNDFNDLELQHDGL